jgi:ribosomal protein S18 acetylase RimI-like enzyme
VSGDVTLRSGDASDADALVALMKTVAMEGRWIRTQWPFDEAERTRRFRERLSDGRALCIVAERNGKVVGQVTLFPSDDGAELGMFVEARYRGRGLGRRLLDAGESLACERGFSAMELEVYAHNDAALALYRSAGFEEFGDRCVEPRTRETYEVVRMRKLLPNPGDR